MWQLIPVRGADGLPRIGILAHAVEVIDTLPADQVALADELCLRRNRLKKPGLLDAARWRSDLLPLEQQLAQLLRLSIEVERQIASVEQRLAALAQEGAPDAPQGP